MLVYLLTFFWWIQALTRNILIFVSVTVNSVFLVLQIACDRIGSSSVIKLFFRQHKIFERGNGWRINEVSNQ